MIFVACDTSLDRTPVPNTGCLKFYLCVANKLNQLSCPQGLLFDQILKKCNYANLVVCYELTTTSRTTKIGMIKKRH